jgi:hypothetical protein
MEEMGFTCPYTLSQFLPFGLIAAELYKGAVEGAKLKLNSLGRRD